MTPKSVKLGDVCTKITKGTTPTTLGMEFSEVGIPFVRVNNFREGVLRLDSDILFISESTHSALARSVIQSGDVLLSIAGTIGRSCVVPVQSPEANCNQAVCIIRTDCAKLDKRFLHRWLSSEYAEKQFAGGKVTGVISNLSLTNVRSLQIPLPPLTEQKRIAGILDAADALRAKRRAALAELDALLQSTFLEMFGDPVTNPMGWEASSLGKTVPAINVGHVGPTSHGYVGDGEGVTFLRTQNVRRNKLDLTDVRYISDEFADQLRKSRLRPGDVLVSRVGANRGMAAVVPNALDGANCANIVIVRSSPKLVPTYLAELINGPYGERTLIGNSVGAAQGVINVGMLDRWSVLLPPIDLQNRFAAAVKAIELQKERMYNHLAELDALFASLQSRAFNGEL